MPDASQFAAYARLLRLKPVDEIQLAPPAVPPHVVEAAPGRTSRARGVISFLILVLLPTALAAGYFASSRDRPLPVRGALRATHARPDARQCRLG